MTNLRSPITDNKFRVSRPGLFVIGDWRIEIGYFQKLLRGRRLHTRAGTGPAPQSHVNEIFMLFCREGSLREKFQDGFDLPSDDGLLLRNSLARRLRLGMNWGPHVEASHTQHHLECKRKRQVCGKLKQLEEGILDSAS